jgi:hypothetical protein
MEDRKVGENAEVGMRKGGKMQLKLRFTKLHVHSDPG